MKKLDGTVTLSILDEDNSQRVIFRIFPLCTKDGLIFQNRKVSYPDFGSLRIIPDKREQSSFKDRMREMGKLCCVHLINDGKELTKIRQNRNYDPNQDECNQYAIYSDVVCGFTQDAVFEVFQENEDISNALSDSVLLQKGKILYGPVDRDEAIHWETLKPFGNENYLLHTVEDHEGNPRTYYWDPDAIVTWRQRKKDLKQSAVRRNSLQIAPETPSDPNPSKDHIPIGEKLEILNEELTNEEHITELNIPLPDNANRLEQKIKPTLPEVPLEAPKYNVTPMTQSPRTVQQDKQNNDFVHGVVEKQIKAQHSVQANSNPDKRLLDNPMENLREALENVWSIPSLHQELFRLLNKNEAITKAIVQSDLIDKKENSIYSAVKAELDDIEGQRISLLMELDKAKSHYQHFKNKTYTELSDQKKAEIETLNAQILERDAQKQSIEKTLAQLGEDLRSGSFELLQKQEALDIKTNGSDIIISPTVGVDIDPKALIETIRSTLSGVGFMCKQDCVTELLILLSLHDEFCLIAKSIPEAELYMKTVLRALGLQNVSAWPSVFGTLRVASLLPENDLRTPTVEVIKNNRTPIKAYGHKTIRLIDENNIEEAGTLPVFRVPVYKAVRGQENRNATGKPVNLRTIHTLTENIEILPQYGEEWFAGFEQKLKTHGISIQDEVYHAMRVFARVAAPMVIGGFMEAADTAALTWIVPVLMARKTPQDLVESLIGDLPKCTFFTAKE